MLCRSRLDESPDNLIFIRATLSDKQELRYTPAGIAVFEAKFEHRARVHEAGAERVVQFCFTALAFADVAIRLNEVQIGSELSMKGFLATRSLRSSRLTVHITEFK